MLVQGEIAMDSVNKIQSFLRILLLFIIIGVIPFNIKQVSCKTKATNTYALLVDQFAPNSVNPDEWLCNAIELKQSLKSIGWPEKSFKYLFGEEEITQNKLREKLDFLESEVDSNDVVIVYFATHGYGCLHDILDFNTWFHKEFLEIPTDYKYLLIDACHAGEFIAPLQEYVEDELFYAMGSVAAIEYAIGFTEDDIQGEPWNYSEPAFLGIISSHFWSKALTNSSADINLDSYVSMEELYDFSLPLIKKIYSEVFEQDSELAEWVENRTGYIDNYPNPLVVNSLSAEISLNINYLEANMDPLVMLTNAQKYGIIFGVIGGALIIGTTIVVIGLRLRKKKILDSA